MNVCNIVYARKFINIFEKTTLEIKKHIKSISIFFGMVCAVKIHSAMDTVMIGFMMDDSAVGYYTAASKIRRLVVQMITAITGTLLSRSSYYIERHQIQKYDDMVKKAITLGVSKVNVNTECQIAFTEATKKYFAEGKDEESKGFTPRALLAPGLEATKRVCIEKMTLFGSIGKA